MVNLWKLSWVFLLGYSWLVLLSCQSSTANDKAPEVSGQSEEQAVVENADEKVILFFGNSLTAGYGLAEEESFPSLIQGKIDEQGLAYKVVNAGLSGETSAGGLGRIDWVLNQPVDLFVLELGPNDALRGLDLGETRKNLRQILERVQATHPGIPMIVVGMMAPPNMGADFTNEFASIYPDLASEYDAGLVPFLLEGVAGDPDLNLNDGIHPNAEGQKIVASNVWQVLESYLVDTEDS